MTLPQRFWDKVNKSEDPNGCWIWTAATFDRKYDSFKLNGSMHRTHVLAFLDAGGILTEDKPWVLHKCHLFGFDDNKLCVRPSHLEAGNSSDNVKDAMAGGTHNQTNKTHCPQGHEYTLENTYLIETRNKYGTGIGRGCKICRTHSRHICERNTRIRKIERD